MKRFFASQVCVLSYPEILDPDKGRNTINKKHNDAVKDGLEETLRWHQKVNVPKHFQFGAHNRYKYKKRSGRTLKEKSALGKRYLDLVMSGKSKQKFTTAKGRLRRGGNTYSGTGAVNVTLTISWPPGYYDNPSHDPRSVKKKDMVKEIEAWTSDEKLKAAKRFGKSYVRNMKISLARSPKMKKKYASKLAAQGI